MLILRAIQRLPGATSAILADEVGVSHRRASAATSNLRDQKCIACVALEQQRGRPRQWEVTPHGVEVIANPSPRRLGPVPSPAMSQRATARASYSASHQAHVLRQRRAGISEALIADSLDFAVSPRQVELDR